MQTQRFTAYFVTICLLLCTLDHAKAGTGDDDNGQKRKFDPSAAILIVPNYTVQFPFGDMSKRFGINSLFSAQLAYKTKRNWLYGVEGGFIYGAKVKESYILDNVATSSGKHITQETEVGFIKPEEYGMSIKFTFGKVLPLSSKFPDAGILLITGVGFLQHQIGLNVRETKFPQFSKIYRKGYDRLSNGPVISQFIGGTFIARRKFFSLYGGLQFDVAFTQGRRNYDFYLMQPLKDKRIDMFLGIKLGWIIPIFTQSSEKEFFYY